MSPETNSLLTLFAGVVKDYKAQGLSKAMFSGEGFFVYKVSGIGIMWISSLGAIIRKDVRQSTYFLLWGCGTDQR